jgi:two-component system response regulator FlrC
VIRPDHIQFELANDAVAAEPAILAVAPAAGSIAVAMGSAVPGSSVNSLANSLDQTERDLILDALRSGQGSRREAAERLGISQRTLRYKLARLREAGIDVPAA